MNLDGFHTVPLQLFHLPELQADRSRPGFEDVGFLRGKLVHADNVLQARRVWRILQERWQVVGGGDDNRKRSMVGHVLDDVRSQGIVQCDTDESECVTGKVDDLPFRSIQGPDTDGKVGSVDVFGLGTRVGSAGSELSFVFQSNKGFTDVESSLTEFAVRHLVVQSRRKDGALRGSGRGKESPPFHDRLVGVDRDRWSCKRTNVNHDSPA